MSQITSKWITDGAITPAKLDSSGTFTMTGLNVLSDATVGGNLAVTGNIDIGGDITLDDATASTMYIINDASVGGDLTVTGNANIGGDLTFDDATVDTIDVLTQLNANNITGTPINLTAVGDSTFFSDTKVLIIAPTVSVVGNGIDATLASTGPVNIIGTPVNIIGDVSTSVTYTNGIDLQAASSYLKLDDNVNASGVAVDIVASQALSLSGDGAELSGGASDTTVKAGSNLSLTGNNIIAASVGDSTYSSDTKVLIIAPTVSMIGNGIDATLASTGPVNIIGTPINIIGDVSTSITYTNGINLQTASSYLKLDNNINASGVAVDIVASQALSLSGDGAELSGGASDTTVKAGSNLSLTGNNILAASVGDSTYSSDSKVLIIAPTVSMVGNGQDATLASTGTVKLLGAGVDVNCLGPFNVQAYDGSDAFQLTGGAGDFVFKQDSGVNQIISQNAPFEIKALGSEDMTVWPQGNLRLFTGGSLFADINSNILFDSANDSTYSSDTKVLVIAPTVSMVGNGQDATLASTGRVSVFGTPIDATSPTNIFLHSSEDSTYSSDSKVQIAAPTVSVFGNGIDATFGSTGPTLLGGDSVTILSTNALNITAGSILVDGYTGDTTTAVIGGVTLTFIKGILTGIS